MEKLDVGSKMKFGSRWHKKGKQKTEDQSGQGNAIGGRGRECGEGGVVAGDEGGKERKERAKCGEIGIVASGGGKERKESAECGEGGVITGGGDKERKERAECGEGGDCRWRRQRKEGERVAFPAGQFTTLRIMDGVSLKMHK